MLTKSVPQTGNLIPNGRPSVDENGALLIIGPGSGTGTPTPYTVQVPRAVVNSPSDIFQYFFMYASTLDIANSYWNTGGAPGAPGVVQYQLCDQSFAPIGAPVNMLSIDATGKVTVLVPSITVTAKQWFQLKAPSGQTAIPALAGCIVVNPNA